MLLISEGRRQNESGLTCINFREIFLHLYSLTGAWIYWKTKTKNFSVNLKAQVSLSWWRKTFRLPLLVAFQIYFWHGGVSLYMRLSGVKQTRITIT